MTINIPASIIERMIDSLDRELNFYRDLETLLIEERDAIVNFDNDKLTEINFKKESLLLNIIEVKNQREKIISEICDVASVDDTELNLTFFSEHITSHSKIFLDFKNNFKRIGKKIQSLNEINKHVISSSLNFIKSSLNIIYQSSNRSTYSNYGKIKMNQNYAGIPICNNKV